MPPFAAAAAAAAAIELTKYERTHVIGVRAEQLARGAQAFVELPEPVHGTSANAAYLALAERELEERRLPFLIMRKMPDGSEVAVRS
jgi:DNA-directed RNA polymerase subunit K/omega